MRGKNAAVAFSSRSIYNINAENYQKRGRGPCATSGSISNQLEQDVWCKLTEDYFSGITLADLMDVPLANNYVI